MMDCILADGPVLAFGGPYSNLEATQAVLAEAKRRNIPPQRIVCTGDLAAYGADAAATLALIRASGAHVVAGNWDEALATRSPNGGCGFSPGSACESLSTQWFAHADRQLGAGARAWLGALPRRLDLVLGGVRLAVVHASPRQINEFVFASTPERVKALDLALAGTDGIVAGHCGLPFTQVVGRRLWHNPGVIGLPANDGTPRIWFSVLNPGAAPRSLQIEHVALAYDDVSAAAKVRMAGLPDAYADALSTGVWPCCEVLPPVEAAATGRPLTPGSLVWKADQDPVELSWPVTPAVARLNDVKFRDPDLTASGERRAHVSLERLHTLWINTGTLCNLACQTCYIESTPRNDSLVHITTAEVRTFLDEIERDRLGTRVIGFTGGEPFMNREFPAMLEEVLARGFELWCSPMQ